MVLDFLKRALGGQTELDPYERRVLEKEHRAVQGKIDALERKLGRVHCASCVKKEDPVANRLIATKRSHLDRLEEIERTLGYTPDHGAKSKRRTNGG